MTHPDTIAPYLLRAVGRAVREFDLIAAGDRIAVGVSGGKDSRTLLELLVRGVHLPGSYAVVAVHIDGSEVGLPDLRPQLEPWFRALGVPYEMAPLRLPEDEPLPLDCFRCSWNRRKALFHAAERLGCNKVALGHHADDATVTTLLNILYQGRVEGLAPRLEFFDGRFTLIRPLIYVTEQEIKRYARAHGWAFAPELECERSTESRRIRIEQFLGSLPLKERKQVRANLARMATTTEEEDA